MVLKKQTVFLLTLLTLMVVLFTYQLTSEPNEPVTTQNEDSNGTAAHDHDVKVTSIENGDDFFTAQKMERANKYEAELEQLYSIMGDTTRSSDEIAEASTNIKSIEAMISTEFDLEEALLSMFPDAMVLTDNNNVQVFVKANELTAAQADEVIQLVRAEMNVASAAVTVEAKPIN